MAIVILLAILFLSACTGGRTRAYSGSEQPSESVALLKHQTGFGKPSVKFVRIDDQPIAGRKYQYGEIELLPGRHEVEFGFEAAARGSLIYATDSAIVVFEAEANHEYEARAVPPSYSILPDCLHTLALWGNRRWIGIIVDLRTDKVVANDLPQELQSITVLPYDAPYLSLPCYVK